MNTTVLALQEEQVLAAVGRPGAKPSVQALYRAPAHGGGMENWERAVGALWQAHDLPTAVSSCSAPPAGRIRWRDTSRWLTGSVCASAA